MFRVKEEEEGDENAGKIPDDNQVQIPGERKEETGESGFQNGFSIEGSPFTLHIDYLKIDEILQSNLAYN